MGKTCSGLWLTKFEYVRCPDYVADWAQGGPIIEQEGFHLRKSGCEWQCDYWNDSTLNFDTSYGPTILIAAMRCFVASKLGDTVEVPDELMGKID